MNIRSRKAIQTLHGVNPLLLYYYQSKTPQEVDAMIENITLPFKLKDAVVDDKTIEKVREELLKILPQESEANTFERLCKSYREAYVAIDNALLLLGQYYPANLVNSTRKDKDARIICPLTRQRILPEVPRFILSCGVHLSLNGIMAADDDIEEFKLDKYKTGTVCTISLTQRDKKRIKLFKLHQHNSNMQKQTGIASALTGEVIGLIAVYNVSLHFTVALFPLIPAVSLLAMPLLMGFVGMAISQYSHKQEENTLKEMIGDAPLHTSLQKLDQLHSPPVSRWNLFSLCRDFSSDTNESVYTFSHARNQAPQLPHSLHFLKL